MYASVALGSGHKMVILHYNPDGFRIDKKNRHVSTKDHQKRLVEILRGWLLKDPVPQQELWRYFLYYDSHSDSHLPDQAKNWQCEGACEISSILPM